jgi:hypothetical protein
MDTMKEAVSQAIDNVVNALGRFKHEALKPGAVGRTVYFNELGEVLDCDGAEQLITALSKWDFMDEDQHASVHRFPGVAEASKDLLEAIANLNEQKTRLEQSVGALPGTTAKDRQRQMRELFKKKGMGRAHPLQCWREVRILGANEFKTIGFSTIKSSFGSVALSKEEALLRLERREALDIAAKLAARDWETVRWVMPVSPFVKANVSYREYGKLRNATFHGSLPIILPTGSWPEKVKYNVPKASEPTNKLEDAKDRIALPFRKGAYLAAS